MKSNIKSDEKGVVASKKTNKALPRNRIQCLQITMKLKKNTLTKDDSVEFCLLTLMY